MPVQENDYALVIGIEEYPEFRDLEGPIRDAMLFNKWLVDKERGGGLDESRIELVIIEGNVDHSNPKPIGQDVSDALKTLYKRIIKNKKGVPRRFYFFFSGHGHTTSEKPRDSNLCMAPFNETYALAEALSLDSCLSQIRNCIAPQELIVFLDCCRSIIVSAAGVQTSFRCANPIEDASKVREWIAYATLNFQPAFEGGEKVRGHFSRALIEGLEGNAGENGVVSIASLAKYLKKRVKEISRVDRLQEAEVIGPLTSEIAFGNPMQSTQVEITFSEDRVGMIKLEDGKLNILHEDDASTGPWRIPLDKGRYFIYEADSPDKGMHFVVLVSEEPNHVKY